MSPSKTSFLALVVVGTHVMILGCDRSGFPKAIYKNMEYVFQDDEVWCFSATKPGEKLADIYLRTSGGNQYHLTEVSEETASTITGDSDGRVFGGHPSDRVYRDGSTTFEFRKGILVYVRLSSGSYSDDEARPFLVSATKEGPYVEMPRAKEELVALFGEPMKWGTYDPPATP